MDALSFYWNNEFLVQTFLECEKSMLTLIFVSQTLSYFVYHILCVMIYF